MPQNLYANVNFEYVGDEYYYEPQRFSEGLAAVCEKINGKWGFIDTTGKLVIPYMFDGFGYALDGYNRDNIPYFSNGVFIGQVNGKYSAIDKSGNFIAEPKYEYITRFVDGLAFTSDGEYIDNTGKVVIKRDNAAFPQSFHEGYAAVVASPAETGRLDWTLDYIDESGNYFAGPNPNWRQIGASHFSEGLVAIDINETLNGMFRQGSAYIDGTGQYVIGPMWDIWPVGDFHDGLAKVRVKSDDKYGYIDKSGNLVIKPQWDGAYDFKDGVSMVYYKEVIDGEIVMLHGYIDKCGNEIIPLYYKRDLLYDEINEIKDCSEERIAVKSDGKWGFYDNKGNLTIRKRKTLGYVSKASKKRDNSPVKYCEQGKIALYSIKKYFFQQEPE